MDPTVTYTSYYLETCYGGNSFFTIDKLPPDIAEELIRSFRSSGGLRQTVHLIDDYPNKRFIISEWDSGDSYDTWLKNPLSQRYIQLRDRYNLANNITSMLIGVIPESKL